MSREHGRHCEERKRRRSIATLFGDGLLRFARNDGQVSTTRKRKRRCTTLSSRRENPTSPPSSWPARGEIMTYGQLDERSNQGAQLFRSLGLKRGDVDRALLENHPRYFEICWAAQRAGLYYTCISSEPDGRRGRVHRARLRGEAVHHVSRASGRGREARAEDCRSETLFARRGVGAVRELRGGARENADDADRRRDRRASTCSIPPARPGGRRASSRADGRADRFRQFAGAACRRPVRLQQGHASICRRRRSITPRRCAGA